MRSEIWRWVVGLLYILAVSIIWVGASFVVQSVIDAGTSAFLVTYLCNSVFLICIPIFEIMRYFEDSSKKLWFWSSSKKSESHLQQSLKESEEELLREENHSSRKLDCPSEELDTNLDSKELEEELLREENHSSRKLDCPSEELDTNLDSKGRWTRTRTAKLSLLLCPIWFFAYYTFNLSLKYTTVTSTTIICNTSSFFTFLISLVFLGEKFKWIKLISVILCMGGTIIVSVGDMETSGLTATSIKPLIGDILAVANASLLAVFVCIIRKHISNDDEKHGRVSMAQMFGYLGLFNTLMFLPVGIVLHFTKLETFHNLTWLQLGLILGKGLLDNVLGDYLLSKAVLLTTPTVATAGLTIQVPLAAIVDAVTGHVPHLTDYLGAIAIFLGFAGINFQATEIQNVDTVDHHLPISTDGDTHVA